jgi:predicted MFS family arabinose efflux permease
MLVVLHFHQLGYSPLSIALLFLFYELFGVITNLLGGWLGARLGLNNTMTIGLGLQVVALTMLLVPAEWLIVPWVMAAQAVSGIAKDLNKMSAKSTIKLLIPDNAQSKLYQWVALLTGSKNALKGIGFFMGGMLLTLLSFQGAVMTMALGLVVIGIGSQIFLKKELGKSKNKPTFIALFSKSRALNYLSAARLFLFGARDVWFVVALPVYLSTVFEWSHWQVSGFLASWIIGYGLVQTLVPYVTGYKQGKLPDGKSATVWSALLASTPLLIIWMLAATEHPESMLITGLLLFGLLFAINSAVHSYLIISYATRDGVSLDVGFYYMANAMGRLLGTVLSGWIYQDYGLIACLYTASAFIALASLLSLGLPKNSISSKTNHL